MGGTDINTILDQILQASNMSLEDSKSAEIHGHRMKNALFSVLCEIKERTCVNYRNLEQEDPPDPQLMRLDNMLVAEGVVGAGEQVRSTGDSTTITHPDYKNKLSQIRTIYSEEMEKYQQGCEVGLQSSHIKVYFITYTRSYSHFSKTNLDNILSLQDLSISSIVGTKT